AHGPGSGLARCGAPQPAAAQRQKSRTGGTPDRHHLRRACHGTSRPGRPCGKTVARNERLPSIQESPEFPTSESRTPTVSKPIRSGCPISATTLAAMYRYPELDNGRAQAKNLSLKTRDAALRRRARATNLRRGQGFRRAAPPAPYRSENRNVPWPPGTQIQEGLIPAEADWRCCLGR